jgi:DNA polymerase III alpha subunit (gram-positive type)
MSWIMVDVEADGPIPGDYSMVSFGAVLVDKNLDNFFYGATKPISEKWVPEALAISNIDREQHEQHNDPKGVMEGFKKWINENSVGRPMFIADNNGFDYMFIHWYFIHFLGEDPFGHSSTNLGSLWKGMIKNTKRNFKHLRKTKHDHNPVNDAKGNAEALWTMKTKYNLNINL